MKKKIKLGLQAICEGGGKNKNSNSLGQTVKFSLGGKKIYQALLVGVCLLILLCCVGVFFVYGVNKKNENCSHHPHTHYYYAKKKNKRYGQCDHH